MGDTSAGRGDPGRAYLAAARRQLAGRHERLVHCLSQLDDRQVWWRPREGMNSIGNLVLHLCGNLRQWVVSGVGGAPDVRDRPAEFAERGPVPRDELLRRLAAVVAEADAVLAGADGATLPEPRTIQGFQETVLSALFDCLVHLGGHAQEVVCLTRLQLGDAYRFAWVPTPEQGGTAGAETVAVRDATFADMSSHPLGPDGPPAAAAPEEPPLRDYVRELGQEFQDEQDEGKLR
jgi:hypothetical protein